LAPSALRATHRCMARREVAVLRVPVIVFGLKLVKRVPFGGALESVLDLQNTSSQISVEAHVKLFLGVRTSLDTVCNQSIRGRRESLEELNCEHALDYPQARSNLDM
jgi:hypothetical protein